MNTGKHHIEIPLNLFKRGKVRDVFETDGCLLIVSSDRISAFDYVLPSIIPDKGKVLNQISVFWFRYTQDYIPNHIICDEPEKLEEFKQYKQQIAGRSVLTKKLKPFPIEAIVRAYIVGSGWASYQKSGEISGVRIPSGLHFADPLAEPIFTPTTKADIGHDENITFEDMKKLIGDETAKKIKNLSLELFTKVSHRAREKGIIIADTKFEFGQDDKGQIILIDEIFTPDSSRFWKLEDYSPGKEPPAYDKQFVRNYLINSKWDRKSAPPYLPQDIIMKTREKYLEIFKILTGKSL
ncbi:MAG: phosphoribosylaminoimidazolesuccinocarboxamide synthase [Candidatus Aminicenantes bacterium]|nr:phosphoribosylaminoimidazolesuccinocarboxamide synthase [Candidatus Aminicenantes bacterium]